MRKKPLDLEKNLLSLETIVTRLEQGDLPLEEALRQFEQGVALTRACQQALAEAEQKVEMLLSDKRVPFRPDEADAGETHAAA
jgi:exodeoxyribonuclease VII small subunit